MAVNASPMYQAAEDRYRAAATPAEKVAALEAMLRLVPKHKASEKLQAQIKQKLKNAREEMQRGSRKGGHAAHDPFHVPTQGAGQVRLLGPPNVGKSSIVAALTNAKVEIADFPFSTHAAVPGMAHFEDAPIQLVDMPPILDGQAQPGAMNAYRLADIILIVVDLAALDLVDELEQSIKVLKEHGMAAASTAEKADSPAGELLRKRALIAANKLDLPGARDNFDALQELWKGDVRMLAVSARSGEGLGAIMEALFSLLNVIRVYAKKPGKPAEKDSPFLLPAGATVHDMALQVHKDVAEHLKGARVWGAGVHDGQQVHAAHVLVDGNVVELHASK